MSFFLVLGSLMILLGVALGLAAFVMQIIDAFNTSTGWGLISVIGFLFLSGLPNLIYILVGFKERWPPLVIWLCSLPPFVCGAVLIARSEGEETALR